MSIKVITQGAPEIVKGASRWDITPDGILVVTSHDTEVDAKGVKRWRTRAVFAAGQWVGVKLADA